MATDFKIALAGNPNCGKSSLFNALTGLRQKVGNFPGVTVDRKSGDIKLGKDKRAILIDLPGTYSLYPASDDERVCTRILTQTEDADHPDLVVMVVDATNLRRGLLLCTQVMDLGLPVILALNMTDLLEKEGQRLRPELLQKMLAIPVVEISALRGTGLNELLDQLKNPPIATIRPFFTIPASFDHLVVPVAERLGMVSRYQAWMTLMRPDDFRGQRTDFFWMPEDAPGEEERGALINNEFAMRYDRIEELVEAASREEQEQSQSQTGRSSDRLDRILLHPVAGYLIFLALLFTVFQAIFAWATYPMDMIDKGFSLAGAGMASVLPEGWFSSLLVEGIWAGLGGIIIFVPQIAMLFFFISMLEDSGYMSRIVFLMDRIVRPFGFSGRSVIPLIGGMACAVPSIMMARNIPSRTERIITIMVTPLMSCSARIPVYVLLIGMFVPATQVLGIFNLQGIVMTIMYLLGFFMALAVAWIIKTIARYNSSGIFVSELPIYRVPRWRNTFLTMWHKSSTFVWEAGRIILLISMVLWVLKTYGPSEQMAAIDTKYNDLLAIAPNDSTANQEYEIQKSSEKLKASYAGIMGRTIEPLIRPLGFDWKIGISLVTSFAAREVFVGTMATLYSSGPDTDPGDEGQLATLREKMFAEVNPSTGKPIYTTAVALSLLVFYAFAMQCMSTLAVVRKETGSWKMTMVMLGYMTGLAYAASFLVNLVMG